MDKFNKEEIDLVLNVLKHCFNLNNLSLFWNLNRLIKMSEKQIEINNNYIMIALAKIIINNNEIKLDNKYYNFIKKYSEADSIKNCLNQKLNLNIVNFLRELDFNKKEITTAASKVNLDQTNEKIMTYMIKKLCIEKEGS